MGYASNLSLIKLVMKLEKKGVKSRILISSIVLGVITLIMAGLHLARFSSVVNFQKASGDPDYISYDTWCSAVSW